ncbi:MAG: magnesium transporter, partial [Rhodospirillales bacterium]|nr:magnesium transporter [Rhodospirillales bacterium]
MITAYYMVNERLEKGDASALSAGAVWIDLYEPTVDEEAQVAALLGIDIPTREEMQEIEASS